jgi:hypothetical protein
MKLAISSLAIMLVAGVLVGAESTTVTNRGQVITVTTLSDTAANVKDADMYQDFSVYPSRIGMQGKIVRFYDYGLSGVGTNVALLPKVKIPDNVLIRNGYYQILEAATTQTTNNFRLNSASDILASGTNGLHAAAGNRIAIVPVGTAATSVQATADRYLTLEVTTGSTSITNGRFMVVLDCELAP